MSELRQDKASGRWVVIAPERGRRPREWAADGVPADRLPAFDPACPFCPGNEALLPGIVAERPAEDVPGWRTRVVPNKFPALGRDGRLGTQAQGIYTMAAARGRHEVVIETPCHNADLALMSRQAVAAVIATYRQRYDELMRQSDIRSVVVFRNYGRAAGASLRHPHSQIIALAMVPPGIEAREAWGRRQYDATGACVCCEIVAFELEDRRRLVLESDRFVAFVPFAAASPFELWLVPKRHQASFAEIGEDEQADLANLLGCALRRLRCALADPPYNTVIETASKDDAGAPHLHWYLRIVPNLVTPGGFELGSGLTINPSVPEDDAATLRSVAARSDQPCP
jgi:UDPglucose--hexose-1-phosphate uridylyltransferase